jgi:hypothetical protein
MAEITTNALAGKIAVLAVIDLKRLNELLGDGKWHAALNLINAIDADAKAVSRSCTALANKVNKKHWSPLLDNNQAQSQPSS